jgi:lysine 2,3-aminomutase
MAHAGLCTLKAFREKADLAIPSSDRTAHPPKGDTDNWARWEWQLGNAVQNADQLKAALAELGPAYVAEVSAITTPIPWKLFPVKITPHMLQSLKRGLAHNLPGAWEAFRASFIPSAEEAARIGDASNGRDGIGEEHRDVNPVKAITKFYENRVLFRVTAMCPAHCRYCFRRRMVTDVRGTWDEQAIEEGIQHIASDGTIKEVILSGGDPLVLGDSHIHTLLCRLREIGHVHRVRIDTRALTTLPQRFTDSLIGILQQDRQSKPVYVVGHFSHAYELEPMAHEACRRLVDAGIPVLAHIPLLRGVNDSSDQLSTLMEKLVDWRVRPYYLIQYIPTPWTEQFRVPLRRGCEIVRELHQQCSGLAIPTFIVHLPGGAGKVPVIPKYVKSKGRKGWIFRTPKGPVLYPEPSS